MDAHGEEVGDEHATDDTADPGRAGQRERTPEPGPAPSTLIGVPQPGTEDFRLWSEWIGRRLADTGSSGIEAHLAAFARAALDLGVEPVNAHVVADRDMPQLCRARAFFRVATALNDDGPAVA
jgi:hypothetical protein